VKAQLRRGSATSLAQMRQDKLLELHDAQIRWNPLLALAFRHLDHQSNGILADSLASAQTLTCYGWQANSSAGKNPQPVEIDAWLKALTRCYPWSSFYTPWCLSR
jgi:hypothetical protein